jgi:apolipoprotein N-acyltransferase
MARSGIKDYADKLKDVRQSLTSFFSRTGWQQYTVLFCAGLLMTFAYAPFNIWCLPFILLSIVLLSSRAAKTAKQSAKYGFAFGFGWFAAGISWVHVAIAEFGGLPFLLSVLLMALLCGYLAIYPALFTYLDKRFNHKHIVSYTIVFWLFTEWLRSWMLTGFPWLSIGYTQTQSPLNTLAPIIGEFGLQAILIGFSALVLSSTKKRYFLATGVSIVLLSHQVQWLNETTKSINIALVQGNIEQSVKWNPDNEVPTMTKYWQLTEDVIADADVIIWPEAAIPRIEYLAQEYLQFIDEKAFEHDAAIVTGIVDYQPDTTLAFNNVIVTGKKRSGDALGQYYYQHSNRYKKHHLLPIGEFVPFESIMRTLAPLFNLPMSSFNRGAFVQENLIANNLRMATAICFEIAFSPQVSANINSETDVILTVSNDAWFGDSHGPWQHLQIAQMRSLELAKPVIRATNNGVSAIIDGQGQVIEQLPQNEAITRITELQISNSQTWFQKHGRFTSLIFISIFIAFNLFNRRKSN